MTMKKEVEGVNVTIAVELNSSANGLTFVGKGMQYEGVQVEWNGEVNKVSRNEEKYYWRTTDGEIISGGSIMMEEFLRNLIQKNCRPKTLDEKINEKHTIKGDAEKLNKLLREHTAKSEAEPATMKVFLFTDDGSTSPVEHNGKIVDRLPSIVIVEETKADAWKVLDAFSPDCYMYNNCVEITSQAIIAYGTIHLNH